MTGYVVGGIVSLALLVIALIGAFALKRARTKPVIPDRDEALRRASLAARRLAKDSRRAQRGTMRGGGTGEGSYPNSDARFADDGPASLL